MEWYVKFALVLVGSILFGVVITWAKSRMARRTVRNWSGEGVQTGLGAAEAALLSSMHPSAIVAVFLAELETAGKARRRGDVPPRAEWIGADPSGRAERAFRDALQDSGDIAKEGVIAVLEALYESTNGKLAGFSGRATVVYHRQLQKKMWKQTVDGAPDDDLLPALPWYLLRNAAPGDWDHLGDDAVEAALKSWQRTVQRYRDALVPMRVYVAAVESADGGFFRYRKDVMKLREGSRITGYHPGLDHFDIPPGHEAAEPEGDGEA